MASSWDRTALARSRVSQERAVFEPYERRGNRRLSLTFGERLE
jgi:hypothetical protein